MVFRKKKCPLSYGLRNQKVIERISVMYWKTLKLRQVGVGDLNSLKALIRKNCQHFLNCHTTFRSAI